MDFTFTPEQDDAADLAAGLVAAEVTQERLRAVERTGLRFDRALWSKLGDAGLLGLHLPEDHDGAGLGLIELARVVVELGRGVAPVPLAAHGAASYVLAAHGATDLLAAAATGGNVLTVALAEEHGWAPTHPETHAALSASGRDGWVLDGAKTQVRAGMVADAFLVPATTDRGVGVFVVLPGDAGVTVEGVPTIDGDTIARLTLDGVRLPAGRLVGDLDGGVAAQLTQVATALACAEQLGVTEGALRITADYARTREQFDRPIGTFQAVSQRLADGYIDTLGARLTLWQALWRLSEGLPAADEVAIAKLWAADAGHRLAHTAVHVHGGVGIDLDGETHRYFTGAKRLEFEYGGTTEQALRIGKSLAAAG